MTQPIPLRSKYLTSKTGKWGKKHKNSSGAGQKHTQTMYLDRRCTKKPRITRI